ncbi:MAG: phage tail protein [Clostridia bacterium]|nr:phage tail protein [Clostridia bacterium]
MANVADIDIEVDPITQKAVELKLKNMRSKTPRVLKNAVNATARQAKKELAAKAQNVYTIKTTKFKSKIKQKNATNAKPQATLTVSGQPNKLEDFQIRKNTKKLGVKARGKKSATLKEMISNVGGRAFVATFSSGHTGILQREGAARLPIKSFYGPSDPTMVGNEKVYGSLEPEIRKLLLKNIQAQIKRVMSK